jgi:hypothetical protein
MYDAFSEFIPLNQGTPGGQPADGEYSLIAPFTQPCFIPKQDGYFLEGDEKQTFASTIVDFMENKVNKIDLQIPLPVAADNLSSDFHVSEIDIIYKESDALALQVVETIPINDIAGTDPVFEYVYLSQKPYKTLPEDEITRVYDKVPVKALGQEIISNRVVYSNFQDKHTPPSFIKYQVGANEKYSPNDSTPYTQAKTTIEYPNQTLKQNRNYQVGVVLSDRYGRQSTVILSNDQNASVGGFGADTIYLPYRSVNDSITYLGDSLKLSFNEAIQSSKNEAFLTPGLYSSNVNDPNYNPLGWQTFKIVVKQIQQEYYNVYSAGAMKDIPYDYNTNNPPSVGNEVSPNTSFVTLINDNINKVPRDLTEVGPQDKSFRSSVVLFGRVDNTTNNFSNTGNKQYIPTNERLSFTTNVIEDLFDLFDVLQFLSPNSTSVIPITSPENAYHGFYKSDSNPFIAEFITTQTTADQFGVFNEDTGTGTVNFEDIENLAIFETAPTVSRLDLYYETSTTGLIEDLNAAVGSSSGGATQLDNWQYFQEESFALGTAVTQPFQFLNFGGAPLSGTAVLVSVVSDLGIDRTSDFSLVSLGGTQYEVVTNDLFYYGADAGTKESYTFTFQFTAGTTVTTLPTEVGNLTNVNPTITSVIPNPIQLQIGDQDVFKFLTGLNGSAVTGIGASFGLTFSIDPGSTGAGNFVIGGSNANEIQNTDTSAAGQGQFLLRCTDAGNPQVGTTTAVVNVIFDEPQTNLFNYQTYPTTGFIGDASGAALYFTNNYTNLTNNIPSSTFGSQSYNSVNVNTSFYLRGLKNNLSSSPNPYLASVCNPAGTLPGMFPSVGPGFYNYKANNALSTGAFYVYFNPRLSQAFSSGTQPQINIRYQIAYRSSSSSSWSTAIDMKGNAANFSGTWFYSFSKDGLDFSGVTFPWSNNDPQIVMVKDENNSTDRYAGLVYAFDQPGEYRILHSNIITTFGSLTNQGFPTSPYSCSQSPYVDGDISNTMETGDFYYPSFNAGGNGDQIGGQPNDNFYRYRISQGSCGTTPTTNVYAREPLAKYVSQFFTNTSLTIPYGTSTSGTSYVVRRMESNDAFGGAFLNPEYTNDGKYQVTFQNTQGVPSSISPCYY